MWTDDVSITFFDAVPLVLYISKNVFTDDSNTCRDTYIYCVSLTLKICDEWHAKYAIKITPYKSGIKIDRLSNNHIVGLHMFYR